MWHTSPTTVPPSTSGWPQSGWAHRLCDTANNRLIVASEGLATAFPLRCWVKSGGAACQWAHVPPPLLLPPRRESPTPHGFYDMVLAYIVFFSSSLQSTASSGPDALLGVKLGFLLRVASAVLPTVILSSGPLPPVVSISCCGLRCSCGRSRSVPRRHPLGESPQRSGAV